MSELDAIVADIRREDDPNRKNLRVAEVAGKEGSSAEKPVRLERTTTWEEWERGRAPRRAICDRITGGRELRRLSGDPRKDEVLRRLNSGERGPRFGPITPRASQE